MVVIKFIVIFLVHIELGKEAVEAGWLSSSDTVMSTHLGCVKLCYLALKNSQQLQHFMVMIHSLAKKKMLG